MAQGSVRIQVGDGTGTGVVWPGGGCVESKTGAGSGTGAGVARGAKEDRGGVPLTALKHFHDEEALLRCEKHTPRLRKLGHTRLMSHSEV